MAKKVQVFTVSASIKVNCTIDIKAESLEDALEQAREMRVINFVDFKGEWIDGDIEEIDAIYKNR